MSTSWLEDILGVRTIAVDALPAVTRRGKLRVKAGSGISLALVDDAGDGESELTITGGGGGGGSGDVVGPASSIVDRLALFSNTTGKLLKQAAFGIGDLLKANGSTPLSAAWNVGNFALYGLKSLGYQQETNNTGAAPAINFATGGDLQKITLSGNVAPTFVAPLGIGPVLISTIGDGTQRTITWPGSVVGTPPPPKVSGRTFYQLYYDGTSYHYDAAASAIIAGNGILDTSGTWSVKPDGATIGVSASGVKVADGGVGTTQLAADAVTYPKIQNVSAASRALGRGSAGGAGDVEELAFTGGLSVSGTNITIADGALSRAKLAPETEYDNGNSGTADTIAFANGTYQKSTLTGNCTFTFTPPASGVGEIQLRLIQGPSGGPYTVTWPALLIWPAGGAPTLSTVAGDQDIISIYWDGTNYYGSVTPEVPDGRVVRWDDAPAMSTTIPTGGGNIGVDPSLGLEWLGKYGVETTIAQHGDTGNTTKRRIVDWRTQPSRTTTTTIAQFTAASFDAVSFNGKALTNGALQVKARYVAHGLSGYTQSGEVLATVRIIAGAVAVGTFLDSFTATQGAAVFSAITIDASGTTVRLRPTADASALNVETFAFFQVTGFED